MLTSYRCPNCGHMIDMSSLRCPACGTQYERDYERDCFRPIQVRVLDAKIDTLAVKAQISRDDLKYLGEDNASNIVIDQLKRSLAESLTPYMAIEKCFSLDYDVVTFQGVVKVVRPDNSAIDFWRR